MKKIVLLVAVLLFTTLLSSAQTVIPLPQLGGVQGWITVGGTQQIKQVTLISVATGVWAVPNTTQPNADFITCMTGTPNAGFDCQGKYTKAIQDDINNRFQTVLTTFYNGLPAGLTADQLLSQNKIYLQTQ